MSGITDPRLLCIYDSIEAASTNVHCDAWGQSIPERCGTVVRRGLMYIVQELEETANRSDALLNQRDPEIRPGLQYF